MTFPIVLEAERDPRLRGMPFVLYKRLLDRLDFYDFTPEKTLALAHECKCSDDTIERALKKLIALGYLLKGPVRVGQPRSYKLARRRESSAA